MGEQASRLLEILRQGCRPAADLAKTLQEISDEPVRTTDEAHAVCDLLKSLPARSRQPDLIVSPLHVLAGLFQQVESEEAFEVLALEGIPELCRIFDELVDSGDEKTESDLMFVLKILAIYQTEEGTRRVIQAARRPLNPDGFMWSVILQQYGEEHPQTDDLLRELNVPLPAGFLRVALLDCANMAARSGREGDHPFDSWTGTQQLEAWLTSTDESEFSYAVSAAAALPFISPPERDQLLAVALDHPGLDVQMEGAWAAVRIGNESGVKLLSRWCLDPRRSARAARYLTELGLEQSIPEASRDPDFVAMAELCEWLAHPQEFGRPPDRIELYDTRRLYWPPTDDERPVWLFLYRYRPTEEGEHEEVGLGMVGSITFALFGEATADLSPVEAYALHCGWELEVNRDPRAPAERSIENGLRLLREQNPELDAE